MRELLERIKSGDRDAQNQLFRNLREDRRVSRTIQSLLYDRSVIEAEDVKAEFWRGVLQGVAVVRYDWGDPVLHLIKRGVWQVKSVVRTEINKRIVQPCGKCGRVNGSYNFARLCEKCSAPVQNVGRVVDIADLDFADECAAQHQGQKAVRLTKSVSTNQRHIVELLIQACNDGSNHPQSDVASILRISKARVTQQMNKIRSYIELED